MHRSKQSIPFALACALAAALSGCGGGDEPAADRAAASGDTAAAAAGVAGACTPPPPVPFDTTDGQPWELVEGYLRGRGWTAAGRMVPVRLCTGAGCVVTATIQSDTATYCYSPSPADTELRMLGMVKDDGVGPRAPRLGFTAENADRTVYLLVRGGTAYALYRDAASSTTRFVPVSQSSGWIFNYCNDHRQHPVAEARWKNYRTGVRLEGGAAEPGGPGEPKGKTVDGTELATGWMACVAGCCRFYGSPPPDGEPRPDTDTLKAGRPGPGPVCPDTL